MNKVRGDRSEERGDAALFVFLGCHLTSDGVIVSGQRLSLVNGKFLPRKGIHRSKA